MREETRPGNEPQGYLFLEAGLVSHFTSSIVSSGAEAHLVTKSAPKAVHSRTAKLASKRVDKTHFLC